MVPVRLAACVWVLRLPAVAGVGRWVSMLSTHTGWRLKSNVNGLGSAEASRALQFLLLATLQGLCSGRTLVCVDRGIPCPAWMAFRPILQSYGSLDSSRPRDIQGYILFSL